MKASNAVKAFLESRRNGHNTDLLSRVIERIPNLELQVNVRQGAGEPVPDTTSTYSDGINRWFSFRCPKGAFTDAPSWRDFDMPYDLNDHCEAIGSTGWDWVAKQSLWVGFDFDALVGHAQGVGLTDEELLEIREKCYALDYIEIRRSTSGHGLHMYAFTEGISTQTHTEHSAVASRILDKMSEDVGTDFRRQVDCMGANLWVWHARSTVENEGFALIKPATQVLTPDDLPHWEQHLDVVRHKSHKVKVNALREGDRDIFDELASAYQHVPLDDQHRALREELLKQPGVSTIWVQDHYLLQTHTVALRNAHRSLGLKGVFETISKGSNLAECNTFCFPQKDGAWKVFRFGNGTKEHASWDMTTNWTWCYLNREPNLAAASSVNGGSPTKTGFQFPNIKQARKALESMGVDAEDIKLHSSFKGRPVVVSHQRTGSDNTITLQVQKEKADGEFLSGWNSADKRGMWTMRLQVPLDQDPGLEYEHILRCLETTEGTQAGWAVRKADGEWTRKNSSSIKMVLQSLGLPKPDAEVSMGQAELAPWKLVCVPFAPEYPGDRQWNLGAPQLRVEPAPRQDYGGKSPHPYWDLLLGHLGKDLNNWIDPAKTGFYSGADYLQGWMASVIRFPFEPLPYLFFFGDQNTGKSSFHEAWDLLITGGVVKAARALTNKGDFNGELLGAVVCVIEEVDLSKDKVTLDRIKDVVTCKQLSIRRMRMDSFMAPNTTHWVHCANSPDFVPVFDGDTRITMIHVKRPGEDIPKMILQDRLKEEAPYFLRTLLDFELPQVQGRLRIPVIETDHKKRAMEHTRSMVELFLEHACENVEGAQIEFSEFYQRLVAWLPFEQQTQWTKQKVSKRLPLSHSTIRGTNNIVFVNNAKWKDN